MGIVRHLQHWLGGSGPSLVVRDFVPDDHSLRLWAETFPWEAMVGAVDRHFATHFPKESQRGRPPVSNRHEGRPVPGRGLHRPVLLRRTRLPASRADRRTLKR